MNNLSKRYYLSVLSPVHTENAYGMISVRKTAFAGDCYVRISDQILDNDVRINRSAFGLEASSIFHERVVLFPRNTHLRNELYISPSDNRT